ncbi:MAG: SGNH/GDSL hydrolase family protein [Candidatus Omnitrophica bacterium]|nr:SGNH/GDSL hydrolase family protein [Candidatus Omnitrophota bacterium]
MKMIIKRILFRITAILIGTICILFSLELFFRINKKIGYVTTSYKAATDCGIDNAMLQRKQYSSVLGFENIPNFQGINSHGLVSKEYKLEKNKDVFRILILGDSIAEGFAVTFLEDLLNQSPPLHLKYRFQVWNAAVGAYDIRRYYLYLKNKGLHFKPDSVIIYFCLNDFDVDSSVYYKDEKGIFRCSFHASSELMRRHMPNQLLTQHSYLYRFIILRLNSYLSGLQKGKEGFSIKKKEGLHYLAGIKDICDRNRLSLFAVVFPYLKPLGEYDVDQRENYENIIGALKELNINFLDLHNYLPQNELIWYRQTQEDQIHHKKELNLLYDKIICNYFLQNLV